MPCWDKLVTAKQVSSACTSATPRGTGAICFEAPTAAHYAAAAAAATAVDVPLPCMLAALAPLTNTRSATFNLAACTGLQVHYHTDHELFQPIKGEPGNFPGSSSCCQDCGLM
jgi:hypothetical protein